jgi:hypothetical protein
MPSLLWHTLMVGCDRILSFALSAMLQTPVNRPCVEMQMHTTVHLFADVS